MDATAEFSYMGSVVMVAEFDDFVVMVTLSELALAVKQEPEVTFAYKTSPDERVNPETLHEPSL